MTTFAFRKITLNSLNHFFKIRFNYCCLDNELWIRSKSLRKQVPQNIYPTRLNQCRYVWSMRANISWVGFRREISFFECGCFCCVQVVVSKKSQCFLWQKLLTTRKNNRNQKVRHVMASKIATKNTIGINYDSWFVLYYDIFSCFYVEKCHNHYYKWILCRPSIRSFLLTNNQLTTYV